MAESSIVSEFLQRLVVSDVEIGKEIGRGSFGVVLEATWKQSVVAVKQIHSTFYNINDPDYRIYKETLFTLCERSSQLSHPDIVRFIGIHCPPSRVPNIVMERLHCSLTKQLEETRATAAAGDQFPVDKKLSILSQVGRGLRYLHSQSPPIIHRNLSSDNVLLSEKLELAKISDLGSVRLVDSKRQLEIMKTPNMVMFMPPEVLSDEPVEYGAEVDVFSFGCVMLHTLSHQWPTPSQPVGTQSEVERRQKYLDVITEQRETWKMKPFESSAIINVAKNCLSNIPKDRPSLEDVCLYLKCVEKEARAYGDSQVMNPATAKRLKKELFIILTNPEPMISVSPVEDDMLNWKATIKGPVDSPYEGGVFHLKVILPAEYPFKPPKITFLTNVYHPNIGSTGANAGYISLDVLSYHWSPALTLPKVLLSVISLLFDPNPDEPLEPEIARMYKDDLAKFNEVAKQWTQQYAVDQ